jgi:hypothetical protein
VLGVYLLLAINIGVVGWAIGKSCFSREGIEFNHMLMFSFGFLIYWILPLVIGVARFEASDPLMSIWFRSFDAVSSSTLSFYLLITLGSYLCFWGGSAWVGRRLPPSQRTHPRYHRLFFSRKAMNVFLYVGAAFAALIAFQLRGQLFTGYSTVVGLTVSPERSTFTAISVFLLSLAFLYTAKQDEATQWRLTFQSLFLNRFFIVYFVDAFLVLSLGGRLYLVSSVVMLLAYRSIFFQRIRTKTALLAALVTMAAVGLAGLARLHASASAGGAAENLLLEPLFTSYSLLYFLQHYGFEWIKFPVFLLSDLANLIPTFLFPGKADILLKPEDYGYVVYSPVGALNSFFSFMINFGVVGTMLFLGILGAGLSYIKGRDRSLLYRVIYVMTVGWLGFTFFRDPFSISIVKSIFQFSFLVPVLTVIFLQIFTLWWRDTPQTPSPPALPDSSSVNVSPVQRR